MINLPIFKDNRIYISKLIAYRYLLPIQCHSYIVSSPPFIRFTLHIFVLYLINIKYQDSKISLYSSSLKFTPIVSMTWTNYLQIALRQGILFWIVLVSSSIPMKYRNRIKIDAWCNLIVIEKLLVISSYYRNIWYLPLLYYACPWLC